MRKVIILIITVIICCGIFGLLVNKLFSGRRKGSVLAPVKSVSKISVDEIRTAAGNVSEIYVSDGNNAIAPDVTISEGPASTVTARLYGRTVSDYKFEFDLSGGTLTIRTSSDKAHVSVSPEDLKLDITVPSGTKLSCIDVKTVSGDMQTDCLCEKLYAETVSGDLNVVSFKGKSVEIESASGDINAQSINADTALIKSISGEIYVGKAAGGDLGCETISGDIEINDFRANSATLSTISGDIEIRALRDYALDIQSASGDIEVGNSETQRKYTSPGKNGTITAKSTSGDVEVSWLVY